MEKEQKKVDVKYITSVAMAVVVDDEVKHLQFTVAQEIESKQLRCFFDVVDPSQVKLKDPDELPSSSKA